MKTLTIRYSFGWLLGTVVIGFLGATVAFLIERGSASTLRALSDPIFSILMVGVITVCGVMLWAIPAARLHVDRVETVAYPFRVFWSDVTRVEVASFFRMNWIKVFGRKSRFSLWIPVPDNQVHAIRAFIDANAGAEVSAVFSDRRLNKALHRTASLSFGRR